MDADTKEKVYDEVIAPLMAQIINACKVNHIPVLAQFILDGDLACTTFILPALADVDGEDEEAVDAFRERSKQFLRASSSPAPLMITTRNASGEITAMEAIL